MALPYHHMLTWHLLPINDQRVFMRIPLPMKLIPMLMLVVTSGPVSASGFQLLEQNASGIGTAYAGSAVIGDNASTVFFNPAAMTRLQAR